MYKYKHNLTRLEVNKSSTGERIEVKINRMVNNKEPIGEEVPAIYTARKDGVQPAYDIRTDRFEIAIDAMDSISKSKLAMRESKLKVIEDEPKEDFGGAEPTQGT